MSTNLNYFPNCNFLPGGGERNMKIIVLGYFRKMSSFKQEAKRLDLINSLKRIRCSSCLLATRIKAVKPQISTTNSPTFLHFMETAFQ